MFKTVSIIFYLILNIKNFNFNFELFAIIVTVNVLPMASFARTVTARIVIITLSMKVKGVELSRFTP